ncbi:MAG: lysophospholipid acyltransferase family protein [Odoribacter sp.]|nr:lysophospholipid acyltransferase family protein [Odoribacter sp.]
MNLINSKDLLKASGSLRLGGNLAAKLVMYIMRLDKINKLYSNVYDEEADTFLDRLIEKLEVNVEIKEEDLEKIPKEGAFITISNHPFGGLDGIILIKLLSKIRPDYKVMANFLLKKIEPIKDYFLAVNPFENKKSISSTSGIKEALRHIKAGQPLGIFPAGEVSAYHAESNMIEDKEWGVSALKMIQKAQVPVIPIYFKGSNSLLFHLLGLIHPMLQTVKLPSELLNKKNIVVKLRIGNPISVEAQNSFTDIVQYGKFLRAKTYTLGSALEVKKFFRKTKKAQPKAENIVPKADIDILKKEVEKLDHHLLFNMKNYSVYCAPSVKIPNILNEIGHLREIMFRAVGEGTNRSIDLDEFDLYYYHLFIWDRETEKIVGAYRVGKGKEIIDRYGIKGFYINTLFKIKKQLMPVLYESIELGRSFIVEDYQRKPLPLFLLWKGILYFLIKNPEYRYLIGPVTISGKYTEISKELIMKFIAKNYYNH